MLKTEPIIILILLALLSCAAYGRNRVWKDELILWQDAVEKSEKKARPRTNLGIVYDLSGDLGMAQREYESAITLEPDYSLPYGPLAVIYGKRGDLDAAIGLFNSIIRRGITWDPRVHAGLGVAYRAKGLFNEAEKEFQEALRISPDYALAHFNLAELYMEMGLRNEAMEHYRGVLNTALPEEKELRRRARAGIGRP